MTLTSVTRTLPFLFLAACGQTGPQRFPWTLGRVAPPVRRVEVSTLASTPARVLAREVLRPSRANLDWAIGVGSPILRSRGEELPAEELAGARVPAQPFGGAVDADSIVASLAGTPLRQEERARALFLPLLCDYLSRWSPDEARSLEQARTAISEERWGLRGRPGVAFQEASELYLHRGVSGAVELWVRIDFAGWARLFDRMPDEDGGGRPQIYARLRAGLLSSRALARVQDDYLTRLLDAGEVRAWGNNLASLWYPSYNTDLVELGPAARWPLASTESEVRAELGRFTLDDPTLILRGKPEGQVLYLLLRVPGMGPARAAAVSALHSAAGGELAARLKRFPVTTEAETVARRLADEIGRHGALADWLREVAPQHRAIEQLLRRRPQAAKALPGRDGFLFYRRSLEYVLASDLRRQPPGKDPFPVIVAFQRYLRRLGVDFLLVPVPTKPEVFPDKLPRGVNVGKGTVLAPAGRQLLLELARAGVESLDLLPAFLEARKADQAGEEELYQAQDTHWTDRGLRLAAGLIAERVTRYPWYAALRSKPASFAMRRTQFTRYGDLHSRLLPREQGRYQPPTLTAQQVLLPDGRLYEDDAESPIVVLGDSFTGVYQRTDCQHAGVTAHLARALATPVDLVMSYGGGPNVRRTLLTRGEADLGRRRLLIWIFAARDLFNYWEDWELVDGEKRVEKNH